jgi:hypothetical protein
MEGEGNGRKMMAGWKECDRESNGKKVMKGWKENDGRGR